MILNFSKTLKCLYERHPDGCLCLEYVNICKHYPHYPFCKLNIVDKLNKTSQICKNNSREIHSDICFKLTKNNLNLIVDFLEDFEMEAFYGSLAYYSKKNKLLFCAINFIDDIMEPEDIIDNIGCD